MVNEMSEPDIKGKAGDASACMSYLEESRVLKTEDRLVVTRAGEEKWIIII